MLLHRFWLITGMVALLLFSAAYYYDFAPQLEQLTQLEETEEIIKEKITTIKFQTLQNSHSSNIHSLPKIKVNGMSELARYVNSYGLIIKTMDISENKTTDDALVHLELKGNFQQLFIFLHALTEQWSSVKLQNFSCKWLEQNIIFITLYLQFTGSGQAVKNSKYTDMGIRFDPFCTSSKMNSWMQQNENNAALSSPLETIKMIGYLQLGNHKQALMLLPNTLIRTVERGSILGSQRGVVIAVNRDKTIIKLTNGQRFILHR